jgi:hypothetical protein
MKRPELNRIPIEQAISFEPGSITMTIDEGAWDGWIMECYAQGGTLIELRDKKPVAAFRKKDGGIN